MVTCRQSVSDIVYRFIPSVSCHFSREFLLGCAQPRLHCIVKVVSHDMVSDVLRSHASVHMDVKCVLRP